ncbi:ankyrin [Piedraia hortae CBS 480.64]|uniref:Ankyrin n=1 Tax=Piedraia hortae CBS 480.64 TaxID=1314780 RepID=A0A6A7BSV0_9PEZI|nr:ankyrin [Piedraia hortae CBS 480.64]
MASPGELLIESCRRNNVDLLQDEVFSRETSLYSAPQNHLAIAKLINSTRTPLGESALHMAAKHGSYDVLDVLLDQEGVEIDHPEPRNGETPLHFAVRYTVEGGPQAVVDLLLDAGCDPRIRDKHGRKPVELVGKDNSTLRDALLKAEVMAEAERGGGDTVVDDEDGE